jgi:flagellar basal body-associated protein FliL
MPSFWFETNLNGSPQNVQFNRAPIVIGRGQGVDFLIEHPTVSRQHGQIVHDPARGYRLVVMSRGGMTAVDGAQVVGEVPLYNGSQIHFGQCAVVFRANDAPQKPGAGGFGAGQSGNFGAHQSGNFGAQQSGNFGAAPSQGGGFQANSPSPSPSPSPAGLGAMNLEDIGKGNEDSKPANVWEEIAASAEAMDEDSADSGGWTDDAPSDNDYYARMQAASARGDEKAKGLNPILMIAVVLVAAAMVYVFFFMGAGASGPAEVKVAMEDKPPVELDNVSCLGEEDCVTQAKQRFAVGKQLLEKKDVHVSNLFEGYKKMLEVKALIEQGKAKTPAGLEEADTFIEESRSELDRIFREQRLLFNRYGKRQMHKQQLQALDTINSYFPDKTTPEYQWAYEKEVELRKKGISRR